VGLVKFFGMAVGSTPWWGSREENAMTIWSCPIIPCERLVYHDRLLENGMQSIFLNLRLELCYHSLTLKLHLLLLKLNLSTSWSYHRCELAASKVQSSGFFAGFLCPALLISFTLLNLNSIFSEWAALQFSFISCIKTSFPSIYSRGEE